MGKKNSDHHNILEKEHFKLYFYPRAYHLLLAGWFSSTLSHDLSVIYFLNLGGVRVLISRKKKKKRFKRQSVGRKEVKSLDNL